MQTTTRNGLKKSESTDTYLATRSGNNDNFDVIDAAIAKCNWAGGALDPTADDDEADGYSAGSMWITDTAIWICIDASEGDAVWEQLWPAKAADLSGTITNSQLAGSISNDKLAGSISNDKLAGSISDDKLATPYLKADGSRSLSANWDAGDYEVRAKTLQSDVATGTAPLVIASTTKVANLNADLLDGADLSTAAIGSPGSDSLIPTEQAVREGLDSILASAMAAMTSGIFRQALINGSFQINQHAVSQYTSTTSPANNDDTYLFDQWGLLSDGNDIVDVSQDGLAAKFEVETANKKFGIVQFIEYKDAIKFAGRTVSLQFKAKTVTGKAIRNIRAAVLSWNSTADSITSDVVSSWGSEGSNPTWAPNWTAENTPSNLALVADAWTTYKIENISIDTESMTNLAVVIWVDDTDAAVDDLLYITDVQLNDGSVCLPYAQISFEEDLKRCMRYWQKSYNYNVAVGSDSNVGPVNYMTTQTSANGNQYTVRLMVPMRTTVSASVYSYTTGTVSKAYVGGMGDKSATVEIQGEKSFGIYLLETVSSVGLWVMFHCVADARL